VKVEEFMKSELNKSQGLSLWAELKDVDLGESRGTVFMEYAIAAFGFVIASAAAITIISWLIK
jgi:hypothetical protein